MLFMEILVATILIYCVCWLAGYSLICWARQRRQVREIAERRRKMDFIGAHIEVRADGKVYLK